jgi:AcrR family transcriptional regulator
MAKYHHGNLRNALIAIATELLAEEGVHALSLRKMAQRAGVSHNAPYMHFADREAVLVAIAEEGFRLLSVEVESTICLC